MNQTETQKRNKLKEIGATFIPCYIFWLLLTMSLDPVELAMGAGVSLASAWFSSGFFVHDDGKAFRLCNPIRFGTLLFFFGIVFLWELIKSNCAMAKFVLTGQKPRQAVVKIPIHGITNPYGLAILADCITMTPGTITMDVINEDGDISMYVQWLTYDEKDRAKAGDIIKGNMEKWIGRVWE